MGRPAKADAPEPAGAGVVAMAYREIKRWALANGVTFNHPDDLGRVNRKRLDMGLPQVRVATSQDRLAEILAEVENPSPTPAKPRSHRPIETRPVAPLPSLAQVEADIIAQGGRLDHPALPPDAAEQFGKKWEHQIDAAPRPNHYRSPSEITAIDPPALAAPSAPEAEQNQEVVVSETAPDPASDAEFIPAGTPEPKPKAKRTLGGLVDVLFDELDGLREGKREIDEVRAVCDLVGKVSNLVHAQIKAQHALAKLPAGAPERAVLARLTQ